MSDDSRPNGGAASDGDRPEVGAAAEKVASGEAVNWSGLESSAPDPVTREVLEQLRRVEGIAAFHRTWQCGPSAPTSQAPTSWGALTIIEEIGRGSSGRVYRARDLRLDREVALKILEPGLASDSPIGRTVIDEGRHLAQLHHPNIVTIHGAERVDGRVGLEMELVMGRTLAEIVRTQGPFSADEAALVGRDVCRALAAVHRAGLVHRDVKAQNVIRESGGRVVLMDLGAGAPANTIESAGIAGTPLYLAPEVLAGSPPTPRSDLYSVGVLLYHLVTGSFPVTASSLDHLRAAHRAETTTRLRDARPDLPERFINLVERALEADPAKRIDSAGRFEAELSQTLGHADRASASSAGRWPIVAGLATAWAMGASMWAVWPRSAPVHPAARFDVTLDGHLTIPHGPGSREFALSPDGASLVYSTMDSGRHTDAIVSLRRTTDVEPRVITTPGGQPFFSPDGTRVGLFGRHLTTVSLADGAVVTLKEGDAAGGGTWGRDGTIVFSSQRNLWRIPETGGTPVQVTRFQPEDDRAAIRPQFLPSGDILFTIREQGGTRSRVAVLTRTGEIRTLVKDATSGRYLPPGYLTFVAGNPPWITAMHFDPGSLRVSGQAAPIQAVQPNTHWFDVSASGTMAFTVPEKLDPKSGPALVWVDRDTGRETPVEAPLVPGHTLAYSLRLSPNGRYLAYTRPANPLLETVDFAQPGPLIIADLQDRGRSMPLITEPVHPLAWSRDSTRITYRTLAGAIAWRPVDGSGHEEVLAQARADLNCNTGEWAPDGRVLLMGCGAPTGAETHWMFVKLSFPSADAVGKAPVVPERYLVEPGQGAPRFSDDGRWIAYSSNVPIEQGARTFVRAFPGPGPVIPISAKLGRVPIWRGRELFYLSPYPTAVTVRTQPTFGFEPPRQPPDAPAYDIINAGRLTFQVSADGRRYLLLKKGNGRGGDYLTRITVVLNWVEEVRRKLSSR